MIKFDNGGRLVQSLSELPNLTNARHLYCDVETKSGDPKAKALMPHHGHRIAGIGITADNHKGAWYVPVRCAWDQWNLPVENVMRWADDQINTCYEWVNHNPKFDAHFFRYDGVDFKCRLVDTMTSARFIDSDRLTYSLDHLSRDWLEHDIQPYDDKLQGYLSGCKSKDYGDVPADIIGEYGCQDVITNRELHRYIEQRRVEQMNDIWETEILLTPVLFDMEVAGMKVDVTELQKKELIILTEMVQLEEQLHKLTGLAIRPHTNPDCYEVLCNKYGLPVLGWTEKGEPSFDKDTLMSYLAHPVVHESPELTLIVQKIQRYRKINTLLTFFVRPYQQHQVDGLMHPDYNQTVRTGRMSCRRPNAQQLSPEAKELIYPWDDHAIVRFDYSQVEFRLIVHYIQALDAIDAYNENPDTDFHTWVAEMCGIPRKPAKNVNFAVAYGGGKGKVVSMLAANMDLVASLADKVDELVKAGKIDESQRGPTFDLLCQKRGEAVYRDYHKRLPTLRTTSNTASVRLRARGYVFNAHGRRRHLPARFSYRAFNTIIQSDAADVMKERLVAVAPRYNKRVREHDIVPFGVVHDEVLFHTPKDVATDKNELRYIRDVLENTNVKYRVPIRTACGRSFVNWRQASDDSGNVDLT